MEFSDNHFNQMYAIASRYLGLRYMSWNLGAWTNNSHAKDDIKILGHVGGNFAKLTGNDSSLKQEGSRST